MTTASESSRHFGQSRTPTNPGPCFAVEVERSLAKRTSSDRSLFIPPESRPPRAQGQAGWMEVDPDWLQSGRKGFPGRHKVAARWLPPRSTGYREGSNRQEGFPVFLGRGFHFGCHERGPPPAMGGVERSFLCFKSILAALRRGSRPRWGVERRESRLGF